MLNQRQIKTGMLLLAFLFCSAGILQASGYKIKVKINNLANEDVILAHYMGENIYPDDTTTLNSNGVGVFKSSGPLTGGMYLVYLPNKKYFDILVGDDQKFTIENDTANFLDNMEVSGSKINEGFLKHQKYLRKQKQRRKKWQQKVKQADSGSKAKEKARNKLETLSKNVEQHTEKMIEDYEGTFLATFLKAMQEVDVPDPPKDEEGNIDSTFQYRYYKNHYFNKFDIDNPRLLNTPIYKKQLMRYVQKVVPQYPDSLIAAVDTILKKVESNERVFRYVLIRLFNHFAKSQIMGMENVYIHIADKYYIPKADWSDQKFIEKLKKRVKKLKPLLIGKQAPNIDLIEVSTDHFIQAKNDSALKKNPYNFKQKLSLHDIDAKYTVLYFWERDCGHCREYTPKLYDVYQKYKDKGVEIVSFHMLMGKEGKTKWVDFINEHQLYEWINAWNPFSYDFKEKYNIKATPKLYLLDEDKEIVAKRLTPQQTDKILNSLLSNQEKQIMRTNQMKQTKQTK